MQLNGARVLVAGGSSGIGLGTAKALALAGAAHVTLVARGEARLAKAAADVRALGATCETIAADLTLPGAVEALGARVGDVDVLVCNVANGEFNAFERTPVEAVVAAWECTALVAYRLAKIFVPGMLTRGRGHVVIVNSPVRVTPYFAAAYKISRTALYGVAEHLRSTLYRTGVGLTYAEPPRISDSGYFDTNAGVLAQLPPMFTAKTFSFLWQTSDEAGRMIVRAVRRNRYWSTTLSVRLLVMLAPVMPLALMRWLLGEPKRLTVRSRSFVS